jgi:hypothetical protein
LEKAARYAAKPSKLGIFIFGACRWDFHTSEKNILTYVNMLAESR